MLKMKVRLLKNRAVAGEASKDNIHNNAQYQCTTVFGSIHSLGLGLYLVIDRNS